MNVRAMLTAGGHRLDEATSALQKCIRQGKDFEACYWAQELESRFYNYVWRRLEVIAQEDVGLADPQAMLIVRTCKEVYFAARAQGDLFQLPLINATLYLARTVKTRMADDVCALIYCNPELRFEVPDDALDMHTARGRALGRGIAHFFERGAQLYPEAEDINPFKQRVREMAAKLKTMSDLRVREWVVRAKAKVRAERGKSKMEDETTHDDKSLWDNDA